MTSSTKLLREEICRIGASLFERGYVHGTAGNISARLEGEGGLLITPTDACLGRLDPAQLAWVGADGVQRAGAPASKTLALHRCIHAATRALQSAGDDSGGACIIHTHSTHCVALSLEHADADAELLPALTPYYVMKVGRVPVLPYRRPGDPETATLAADAIARYAARGLPLRALMLARLGPVVWHTTPAAALATLEELEETARLRCLDAGRNAVALTASQIDELRRVFGASW